MSGKMTDMERILLEKIDQADAIVIGGGSGMSSAAGYDHYHWSSALSDSLAAFREYYNFRSPLDGLAEQKVTMVEKMEIVLRWLEEADAVVIGGASGMSAACGYDYYSHHSPFFEKYFSDFGKIYHEPSCWQLLYHRYRSDEERWAYMARSGCVMLNLPAGQTYRDLYTLVGDKDHYIITTNQDAQFAKVFDPERIFTIQGDAYWMQCAARCHDKIYPSEEILHFSIWKLLGRTSCEI